MIMLGSPRNVKATKMSVPERRYAKLNLLSAKFKILG